MELSSQQFDSLPPGTKFSGGTGVLYHATTQKNWPPAQGWLHVGTEASARFRADYEGRRRGRGGQWYLHAVQITGRAYPHVQSDVDTHDLDLELNASHVDDPGKLPSYAIDHLPVHPGGYKAFPYVNRMEDKGSVSHLVHHSAIKVLHTTKL